MSTQFNWWEDHDELISFARWFWEGPSFGQRSQKSDLLDFFEKPWKWTDEHDEYVLEEARAI